MNALTKEFTEAVEKQLAALDEDVKEALEGAKFAKCIAEEWAQKMARGGGGMRSGPQSWGKQVAGSDQVESLRSMAGSQAGRVKVSVKDITSASSSAGALDNPFRDPSVNPIAVRMPRLRDLLAVVNTSSGSVEYADQTTRDNQAAPQAEGALKAESNYEWELRQLAIRTIAHWTKASVQILADAPQLQSLIDVELRRDLALVEENQLLNGSGTGANLEGLITAATPFAADFSPASETMIDKIGLGILQVTLAEYMPNGVMVHPSDWMRMRLLKNADGEYLLGDPASVPNPLLFGLPVVATTAIAKDKFLIGDMQSAATLYDRQEPTVQLSTEDGDNFVKNMVTIRAEQRVALAVKNPLALSYGDFGNIA